MRIGQLVAGGFLLVLVALIGHNLYWMVRNQREVGCGYSLCVQPRDLAKVAEANPHPTVSGRVALYHFLREHIPGATLTVPPWMADQEWHLERVAGLDVVVSGTPLEIAPAHVDRLTESARFHRRWMRDRNRPRKPIWRPLHIRFDRKSTRYVFAETPAQRGPLFLLSEDVYRKRAASPAATSPDAHPAK